MIKPANTKTEVTSQNPVPPVEPSSAGSTSTGPPTNDKDGPDNQDNTQTETETEIETETQTQTQTQTQAEILVPLDGSQLSEAILPFALSFAGASSAGLTLFRVVQMQTILAPTMGVVPPAEVIQELWDDEVTLTKDYLHQVAERVRKEGVRAVTMLMEDGNAAVEITSYAEKNANVRAVAMSTHGRSGLGRWLFGSVADEVLQSCPVPLLLVRPSEEKEKENQPIPPVRAYQTILVPLDGSSLAEQALSQARSLAHTTGAILVLICVVPAPHNHVLSSAPASPAQSSLSTTQTPGETEAENLRSYLQEVASGLQRDGFAVQTELPFGDPAEEITAFAERRAADIVVMATHGRSGLQRLRLGSVALKVAQTSRLPVLMVRIK